MVLRLVSCAAARVRWPGLAPAAGHGFSAQGRVKPQLQAMVDELARFGGAATPGVDKHIVHTSRGGA